VSPLPNRLGGLRERRELPQRGPGRSSGRQRIFGIFEVNRTLLVERIVPTKPVFIRKNIHPIDDWGVMPPRPLSEYAPVSLVVYIAV